MSNDSLNHAAACGLTKRFGPSIAEVAAMASWRRLAIKVLPVSQRWRLSSLAADIKEFDRALAAQ